MLNYKSGESAQMLLNGYYGEQRSDGYKIPDDIYNYEVHR